MAIATGTALAIGVGVAAAGSVAGSAISANASKKAAKTQAGAAAKAGQLEYAQYLQAREDFAPYREAGYRSLAQLEQLAAQPFSHPDFVAPEPTTPQFVAPTAATLQQDPGYQFRLREGAKALERSAASRGGLFSGSTGKALTQYGQDMASQEYGAAYQRALGENQISYGRDVDAFGRSLQRYQTNFNAGEALRGRQFNELSALTGIGQSSGATLAQLGQQAAGGQSAAIQAGANAQAAGQVGAANAWSQGLGGINNAFQQYAQYQMMQNMLRPTG